jgi:hypothetical protein
MLQCRTYGQKTEILRFKLSLGFRILRSKETNTQTHIKKRRTRQINKKKEKNRREQKKGEKVEGINCVFTKGNLLNPETQV